MLYCSLFKVIRPNSLQAYRHFLFPTDSACYVCERSRLPTPWLVSHDEYSPIAPAAPSLMPLVPSGTLIRREPLQVYHHHLPLVRAGKSSENCRCAYINGSQTSSSLLFCLGACRLLHNALTYIFLIPTEGPAAILAISSPIVCLRTS
jgi:hypothetical protein